MTEGGGARLTNGLESLTEHDSDVIGVVAEVSPLIACETVQAICYSAEMVHYRPFAEKRLALSFRILEPPELKGQRVQMFCRKDDRWKYIPESSSLFKAACVAVGRRLHRGEQITKGMFLRHLFLCRLRLSGRGVAAYTVDATNPRSSRRRRMTYTVATLIRERFRSSSSTMSTPYVRFNENFREADFSDLIKRLFSSQRVELTRSITSTSPHAFVSASFKPTAVATRFQKPGIPWGLTAVRSSARFHSTTMFRKQRSHRKHLTPLEQLVMDYVWAHPPTTAEACRAGVADKRELKESTMRTVLHNLEEKGYVRHTVEGRTYVYRPAETKRNAAVRATQQIIDRFCGGSAEELLIGLVDNRVLNPRQLQQLAAEIAARKEKKA
jgi:predicted transcriptional regulator